MIIRNKETISRIMKISSKEFLLNDVIRILSRAKLINLTTVGGLKNNIDKTGFKIEYLDALIKHFGRTGAEQKAKDLREIREELLVAFKSTEEVQNRG